jgi:hypothetical protein
MQGSSLHRTGSSSASRSSALRARAQSLYASGSREPLRESTGRLGTPFGDMRASPLPPLEGTPVSGPAGSGRIIGAFPSRGTTPSTAPVLGRNQEELKALREENEALRRELLERMKGGKPRGQMMAGCALSPSRKHQLTAFERIPAARVHDGAEFGPCSYALRARTPEIQPDFGG